MLHPTLSQALAAARMEDQQRAVARAKDIRLARRAAHEERARAGVVRFENWKTLVRFAFGQVRVSTRFFGDGVLLHEHSDGDSQDQRCS